MIHCIITILTTLTVALHALLGCCAHHAHNVHGHELHLAEIASPEVDHGDHHHEEDICTQNEDFGNGCHRKHGDKHQGCDESDCSFTLVNRSDDLESLLAYSISCQTLGNVVHFTTLYSRCSLCSDFETSSHLFYLLGQIARAHTQVWRL